jgi:hypothetical protein
MIQRIEHLAHVSVARGCGFAAIAIFTFVVGLSGEMALALKAGGILSLLTAMVLVLKAALANRRPYKRTELWIMLDPSERPQPAVAQQIIGTVLREAYLYFALHAALSAAVMLTGAVIYILFATPPA